MPPHGPQELLSRVSSHDRASYESLKAFGQASKFPIPAQTFREP